MRRLTTSRIGWSLVAVLALGTIFTNPVQAKTTNNPPLKLKVESQPVSKEGSKMTSFAPVIKKTSPSVVNIYSTKMVRSNPNSRGNPLYNDPLFRRFFGQNPEEEEAEENPGRGGRKNNRTRPEQSLGSGVIVTADGYIMTNNHVVDGADEIQVVLQGGREFKAKVVGTDAPTDSAVLKIEATDLPALTLGNSDHLEVGDIVLAIGNPFGIGQTVTMGIISAIGRGDLGITAYEDFIQTDASINPGSSGGALVDTEGRLIGINTAILSRTGGNQGVGFAVPINMARGVIERLASTGKVARGLLGVKPDRITAEQAKYFKLKDQTGAIITEVSPKSPAEEAGLKPYDVITEVSGKKVTDDRHLRLIISQTSPGTTVVLKVIRDAKESDIKVKLAELGAREITREETKEIIEKEIEKPDSLDGVEVGDISAQDRRDLGIPSDIKGALVTDVDEDSTSWKAGIRPGQVILELDRKLVTNAEDAIKQSARAKGSQTMARVWTRQGTRIVLIENKKTEK